MNENSSSDPGAAAEDQLKMIAGQLIDEDFQRDQLPATLWSAIAAKMDRPTNEAVSIRQSHRRAWLGVAAVLAVGLAVTGGLLISGDDRDNVVAVASRVSIWRNL